VESIDLKAIREHLDLFQCPACGEAFSEIGSQRIQCARDHVFPVESGLPMLFAPHQEYRAKGDVTDRIRDFYVENPFPDYEDFDSVGSLVERAKAGVFANALDSAIPLGVRVLEVGCGTGQLSIFLSLAHRQIFGVDLCPKSLQIARQFRDRHDLPRPFFYQMNLFRPIFRPDAFDLVFCSGVLHHTRFPRRGFETICRLVRPGKYIILGLYNKYMRIPTHFRRALSRIMSIDILDPVMRRFATAQKRRTWFNDQYRNPHESGHSIAEVINWFEANDIQFINSIPSARLGNTQASIQNLFQDQDRGGRVEVVLSQLMATASFSREGGLFMVVGKRIGKSSAPPVPVEGACA
jgi:SAM-dependent methyltransferase